jgi:hypothetical protein
VISSPASSAVSTWGVSPGRRWNSQSGSRGVAPSGFTVSTLASRARSPTAMSDGFVAMQASLDPITAS